MNIVLQMVNMEGGLKIQTFCKCPLRKTPLREQKEWRKLKWDDGGLCCSVAPCLFLTDSVCARQSVASNLFQGSHPEINFISLSLSHSTAASTSLAAAAKTLRIVRFVRSSFVCQKSDRIEARYERNDGATKRRKCWAATAAHSRI